MTGDTIAGSLANEAREEESDRCCSSNLFAGVAIFLVSGSFSSDELEENSSDLSSSLFSLLSYNPAYLCSCHSLVPII